MDKKEIIISKLKDSIRISDALNEDCVKLNKESAKDLLSLLNLMDDRIKIIEERFNLYAHILSERREPL